MSFTAFLTMLSYLGISSCGLKLGLFFQLHTLMKTYDIVVMWEETQTHIRVVVNVTYDKKGRKSSSSESCYIYSALFQMITLEIRNSQWYREETFHRFT